MAKGHIVAKVNEALDDIRSAEARRVKGVGGINLALGSGSFSYGYLPESLHGWALIVSVDNMNTSVSGRRIDTWSFVNTRDCRLQRRVRC
jgi:hypothetical protein